MEEAEIKNLVEAFKALDKKHDGVINMDQLTDDFYKENKITK